MIPILIHRGSQPGPHGKSVGKASDSSKASKGEGMGPGEECLVRRKSSRGVCARGERVSGGRDCLT